MCFCLLPVPRDVVKNERSDAGASYPSLSGCQRGAVSPDTGAACANTRGFSPRTALFRRHVGSDRLAP
jgi:hypothetical protein